LLELLERHMGGEVATSASFLPPEESANEGIDRIAQRYASDPTDLAWCLFGGHVWPGSNLLLGAGDPQRANIGARMIAGAPPRSASMLSPVQVRGFCGRACL
jgi:hypothetical protein